MFKTKKTKDFYGQDLIFEISEVKYERSQSPCIFIDILTSTFLHPGPPTEFVEITIPKEEDPDGKPDGNETANVEEEEFPVWIIAILIGVVLILIITGLVFFLMSKKKIEKNDNSAENEYGNPKDPFESREYASVVENSNISMNYEPED